MPSDAKSPSDPAKRSLAVWPAIAIGHIWVTLPGIAVFFAVFFLVRGSLAGTGSQPVAAIGGFVAGWAWWAVMAPRWRRWALARVEHTEKLRQLAILTGLTWGRDTDRSSGRAKR